MFAVKKPKERRAHPPLAATRAAAGLEWKVGGEPGRGGHSTSWMVSGLRFRQVKLNFKFNDLSGLMQWPFKFYTSS
jgi:hypothetical protein